MKNFPNGFTSWQETHFEIASAIVRDEIENGSGHGGLYELAEELTDKFEKTNKNREWDGDFFDELTDFITIELEQVETMNKHPLGAIKASLDTLTERLRAHNSPRAESVLKRLKSIEPEFNDLLGIQIIKKGRPFLIPNSARNTAYAMREDGLSIKTIAEFLDVSPRTLTNKFPELLGNTQNLT